MFMTNLIKTGLPETRVGHPVDNKPVQLNIFPVRLKRVYENFEESSEELRRVKSIKNKLEAHLQSTEKKLRASENETYLLREEIMRRETSVSIHYHLTTDT